MHIPRKPSSYFDKFPETPVALVPCYPETIAAASALKEELDTILLPLKANAELFGSLSLGILGKGEIECAIYLDDSNWQAVIEALSAAYGEPVTRKEERVRIEFSYEGYQAELVLKKGDQARQGKALMDYLHSHPEKVAEYEDIKKENAHSMRAYKRAKSAFLDDIVESLPD